jgi:hypothetical protein
VTPAQLAKLKRLQNKAADAQAAYAAFKNSLIEACTHPETHRDVYKWSYSNGFGRWSTEHMPLCTICRKVQYNSAYGNEWGRIPQNNYED